MKLAKNSGVYFLGAILVIGAGLVMVLSRPRATGPVNVLATADDKKHAEKIAVEVREADLIYEKANWKWSWPEIDEEKMLDAYARYLSAYRSLTGAEYPDGLPPNNDPDTRALYEKLRARIRDAGRSSESPDAVSRERK